ncbi:hypothetical protein [Lactococcus lactis]|uniref:hypothetical protein n=1 Tax=Lactococcus lactis TaxID=1358 RepID=UPI002FE4CA13
MSEIYIEGRFKMPVVNTNEFGYDEEEVKKFDWEDFAKDEFWNSCDDMGELEDKYDITFHKVQPQLTIPQSIADELKEAIGVTNFESTPYSIKLDEDGYLKMWASLRNKKLSEQAYKFCWNNTRVFDTYLNPLTRDLVKVVEG